MRRVGEDLGLAVTVRVLPWRRCLAQVESGEIDAALNASFTEERTAYAAYPRLADGSPDASRALHSLTYALYRRRGDQLDWDGTAFANLSGPIGAQAGYSIVEVLRRAGAQVDDGSADHVAILRKLAFGRIQGAALLTDTADPALTSDSNLGERIERCARPLQEKPYYLLIGRRFVDAHAQLAERLWDGIRTQRDTPAYRQALAETRR